MYIRSALSLCWAAALLPSTSHTDRLPIPCTADVHSLCSSLYSLRLLTLHAAHTHDSAAFYTSTNPRPLPHHSPQSFTMLQCGRRSGIFPERFGDLVTSSALCVLKRKTLHCTYIVHNIAGCTKRHQVQCDLLHRLSSSDHELCQKCGSAVDQFGNVCLIEDATTIFENPSHAGELGEAAGAWDQQSMALPHTISLEEIIDMADVGPSTDVPSMPPLEPDAFTMMGDYPTAGSD